MGQGVLIPVLPIFARDELLTTDVMVGLAVGAKHLGTLACDVPAGVLVSRFGMWRTMLVGILLFAVAAVAAANSPNFTLLFLARFAAGASFAFWMISRHAYIAGAVPIRHRGKALSLYGGMSRVAAIIGPIMGGLLAEYVSLRAPFYAQAVIALLTGLLVALHHAQDWRRPRRSTRASQRCQEHRNNAVRAPRRLRNGGNRRRHPAVHSSRARIPYTCLG